MAKKIIAATFAPMEVFIHRRRHLSEYQFHRHSGDPVD